MPVALVGRDHNVAIKAAQWLADRECGKPFQRGELEITEAPSPLVLPEEQIDEGGLAHLCQ